MTSASARDLRPWLRFGIAVVAMVLLFVWWPYQHWAYEDRTSVFAGWLRVVGENEEWIFCPVVPLVSLWLGWLRRKELASLPVKGHAGGLVMIAMALFSFWVGYKADTGYPGFVAVQLFVGGAILWLGGVAWMRVLLFPWLFMVFMWPTFPLESQLAVPLRLITANASSVLLNLLGATNVATGTGLLSAADPTLGLTEGQLFRLDVAEPCSGIRSLYALLMIAALYGYVFLRRWGPRALLFLSAIPLAVLGNMVRMVLLGLGAKYFGMEFAIGTMDAAGEEEVSTFHLFAGFLVFVVAIGGTILLAGWLENSKLNKKAKLASLTSADAEAPRQTWLRIGAVAGLTLLVLLRCNATSSQVPLSPPVVTLKLPLSVHGAQGLEKPMMPNERAALLDDVELGRMLYGMPTGHVIQASVVLSGQSRRGLHKPEGCTIGQGWSILEHTTIPVRVGDDTHDATFMRVQMDTTDPKTNAPMRLRGLHIFWFQGWDGVSAATYYGHVARTYTDAVFRDLNHRWALMSFFVHLPSTNDELTDSIAESTAMDELQMFIAELAPKLIAKPEAAK